MRRGATILLVEDDARIAGELERVLEGEDWHVLRADSAEAGLALASAQRCDLVLTDFRLPGLSGLELVKRLHAAQPRLPIIMMTAHGTTETAIEATKLGAYDYLLKPFDMPELLALIAKARGQQPADVQPVEMGERSAARDAIVGNSRAMQEVYKEIGRVAAHARHRAHSRRNRHRQGTRRARHLPAQRAGGQTVHRRQLRRHPRDAAGERTVRPRTRRVHRRGGAPDRPLRAGQRRHDLPR